MTQSKYELHTWTNSDLIGGDRNFAKSFEAPDDAAAIKKGQGLFKEAEKTMPPLYDSGISKIVRIEQGQETIIFPLSQLF